MRASVLMVVAAFVLSVAAILVAVISAWYTRMQAVSAEGVRSIEAERRHDELRPTLVGEYVAVSDTRSGLRPGVKLTNQGPLDLDRAYVIVIPAHRAQEAAIEGIYDHRTDGTTSGQETGMIRRGESWTFEVVPAQDPGPGGIERDRGGTAMFRCTCESAGYEPWEITVSVDFPSTPSVW